MNISCDCQSSRPSPKKLCCPKGVEIDYVELPASLGTSAPGQPNAPENGAYKNAVVKYVADGHVYIYTSEGIPVLLSDGSGGGGGDVISVNGKTGEVVLTTSDLENTSDYQTGDEVVSAIENAISQLEIPTNVSELINDANYQTGQQVATAIGVETTAREGADSNLQSQIDAISASSDVTDIVGTYAELQAYDTSTLGDKDIIKVLQDEHQNDETTYYRWSTTTQTFTLIGEEGPYYTKSAADAKFQDKLTAGTNINIDANNEISATDTTYSAGTGLDLTGTTFSVDTTAIQEKLTAGANITIANDNTISATDTTYSDFTGTDGQTAGTAGLVPAPATTDADKFLKSDGTWDTAGGGGGFNPYDESRNYSDVVIPDGPNYAPNNTSVYISPRISGTFTPQNRTVNILGKSNSAYIQTVQIGYGAEAAGTNAIAIGESSSAARAIAIGSDYTSAGGTDSITIGQRATTTGNGNFGISMGYRSTVNGVASLAFGYYASASGGNSVALGREAKAQRNGEVNIGAGSTTDGYNSTSYRVLGGVHPAVDNHDAVNLEQMNARILAGGTAAPTTATVGSVGSLYAYVESGTGHLAICTAADASTSTYTWQTLI